MHNLPDICYLIGAFLGDGCIYTNSNYYTTQFSVTSSDRDFCELCSDICFKIINRTGNIKDIYKKDRYSYSQFICCSKKLCDHINKLTNHKKDIPKFIYRNVDNKIAFIQGIMDADGWITKVNASDGHIRYRVGFKNTAVWTSEVHQIISSLDVRTGKLRHAQNTRKGVRNKDSFNFSVNAQDYCRNIGFRIERKCNLAKECLNWYNN